MEHLTAAEAHAVTAMQALPEADFEAWYKSLPYRVQLWIGAGLVDTEKVLADWWVKTGGNPLETMPRPEFQSRFNFKE